jgi:NhaP-type Na+/H+ or K+/H+ antiporter
MSLAHWSLLVGLLLLTMLLVDSFLPRLPFTVAMIYMGVGYLLGPGALDVFAPDPVLYADLLELVTEISLLIALFAVGLRLGVPIRDRRWVPPLRLAFVSMTITVALIAVVGVWGLDLPLGPAILLGGVLAPTDPVLASAIQSEPGQAPELTRFSLAAEGGLNDGAAFPFVLLGLGLMGHYELGENGWRWLVVDLAWAGLAGLFIGASVGALAGNLVVYLRTRHHRAVGMDEFLALGVIAVAYGSARLCFASGFLAVFTAGLALRRVREHPLSGSVLQANVQAASAPRVDFATHSHHASGAMTRAVRGFNEQLERLLELAMVVVVGAMLPYVTLSASLWWFIPLLFLVLRPLSVFAGLAGLPIPLHRRVMMSWFGIRGIGSVFYLVFALSHGNLGTYSTQLTAFALATVAASILVHGATVHALMGWYKRYEAA